MFFTVVKGQTHPLTEQRPEYHRQYIDIHIVLASVEIIGTGNKALPFAPDGPFKEAPEILRGAPDNLSYPVRPSTSPDRD
ncbi:YhcH/YjgK/YiaL family protein [Raoultella sp. T31]|uniref:YhcH/YjgK/YiaL family protein n=1 Tax=Raoultella sp. T31 TaxID=2054594 RepID=UPI001D0D41CC